MYSRKERKFGCTGAYSPKGGMLLKAAICLPIQTPLYGMYYNRKSDTCLMRLVLPRHLTFAVMNIAYLLFQADRGALIKGNCRM